MARGTILCLGMLALGVAVSLVYGPATRGPFIFDDYATVVDNSSIRQLWPLLGSGERTGPLNPPQATPVHGRPLVNLSLAVNYHFGGLDPHGYRVVHIVVHLLSAMLLWRIVARTLCLEHFRGRFDQIAEPLSFISALVWALHPVNTESVVYVTQRTELLMGACYLATLYCSLRYWAAAARGFWLVAATLACVSGMLCKEMMASAPVMVLLFERTLITGSLGRALRRSWPLYAGLALAWLPVLALNYHGLRTPSAGFDQGLAAHEWWLTQAKVLLLYLKLVVWPWPLVIHYEIPLLKTIAEAWPWLVTAGLLGTGALVLLARRSVVGFVAMWCVAVLSPTLVIPLPVETAAERRMYVPLAAIVPLLIVGGYVVHQQFWRYVARRAGRETMGRGPVAVFACAAIVLAIVFGHVSSRRLVAYRSQLALWQDAAVYQPGDPVVQYNLGTLYAEAGQLPQAILHLEEAVQLDPGLQRAQYNLARALEGSARTREAIEHYRMALRLRPDDAASHHNLARLLQDAGDTHNAIEHYRRAIAVEPNFAAAHTNLGGLLLDAGHADEAVKSFEAAARGQADAAYYMNLATVYALVNRTRDAIPMAEKALQLARSKGQTALARDIDAALTELRAQRPAP